MACLYNLLAINSGSSTLKFQLLDFQDEATLPLKDRQIASNIIDKIEGQDTIQLIKLNKRYHPKEMRFH